MQVYIYNRFLLFLVLIPTLSVAQIAGGAYRFPLDSMWGVAGSFGEIRPSHFHSGIDLKTNESEGKPVYAVANGYVSRIKVSTGGFGRVLYINHPEGYTTVYGHMHAFEPRIQALVDSAQYAGQTYDIEWIPDSNLLPVKKGEVIGISGNTGASEGPHLHFEIRETASEMPLNPLQAGYKIPDTIAPVIRSLTFYRYSNQTWTPFQTCPATNDSTYQLPFDSVGLGIETADIDGNAENGPFEYVLTKDAALFFGIYLQKFSFAETRFANARVDTRLKYQTGHKSIRLFNLPGDSCIISMLSGGGLIVMRDSIELDATVGDYAGNLTHLHFKLMGGGKMKSSKIKVSEMVPFNAPWKYRSTSLTVDMNPGTLYQNEPADIQFSTRKDPRIKLFEPGLQFHKPVLVKVKLPANAVADSTHWLLAQVDNHGTVLGVNQCTNNGAWISAQLRSSGYFKPLRDSLPPVIGNVEITQDTILNRQEIRIPVTDELSGIGEVNVYINGRWTLCWYDPRIRQVILPLTEQFFAVKGQMVMVLAKDGCGHMTQVVFPL